MKKTCEICNGSGQLSTFKGVSRFLLSWEECPECGGLGYIIVREAESEKQVNEQDQDNNGESNKTAARPKGKN